MKLNADFCHCKDCKELGLHPARETRKKSILITTSDFTNEAHQFVKNIDASIVLISGQQLMELMWEHNIGLSTTATYEIEQLDLNSFDE